MEMRGVEDRQGDGDEQGQRRDLDQHQDGIERRALARSGDQQAGHHPDDEDGRNVEDAAQLRALDERRWQSEPDGIQETGRIARPADRHRADDQRIFEDQCDADHPRDHLAEHDVGIGVGRARGGDHRRHFGIGQRCAGADDAGDGERQDDRWPRLPRANTDQGQDAGADDGADAKGDEMRPRQGLLESVMLGHILPRHYPLADAPILHSCPSLLLQGA